MGRHAVSCRHIWLCTMLRCGASKHCTVLQRIMLRHAKPQRIVAPAQPAPNLCTTSCKPSRRTCDGCPLIRAAIGCHNWVVHELERERAGQVSKQCRVQAGGCATNMCAAGLVGCASGCGWCGRGGSGWVAGACATAGAGTGCSTAAAAAVGRLDAGGSDAGCSTAAAAAAAAAAAVGPLAAGAPPTPKLASISYSSWSDSSAPLSAALAACLLPNVPLPVPAAGAGTAVRGCSALK